MIKGTKIFSKRHWKLKQQAQKLRAEGLSYGEIITRIPVAKSTISLWCRNVPLTKLQQERLRNKHGDQMAGIKVIQKHFWHKRLEAFNKGVKSISKFSKSSRFVAGLMLYWAEGTKNKNLDITNSDPRIVKFMVAWFKEFWGVDPETMAVQLHLHSGQNEENVRKYWSGLTGIPIVNFQKSFIKPEGSGYRKKVLYQGTVKVRVRGKGSTYLLFQILGAIAGVLHYATAEYPNPESWMDKLPFA